MWQHTENNSVSDEIRGLGVVTLQRIQSVMRFEGWVCYHTQPSNNSVSDEIRGLGVVTNPAIEYSQ